MIKLSPTRRKFGFSWTFAFLVVVGLAEPVLAQDKPATLNAEQQQQLLEASRLNEQVAKLVNGGKFREALPAAQQALAIRQRLLHADHPDVVTSQNNLGHALYGIGDAIGSRP